VNRFSSRARGEEKAERNRIEETGGAGSERRRHYLYPVPPSATSLSPRSFLALPAGVSSQVDRYTKPTAILARVATPR